MGGRGGEGRKGCGSDMRGARVPETRFSKSGK